MLRKWGSAVAVAAMLVSSTAAFAGSATDQSALTPGSAAGVQQAQGMDSDTTMALLAAGVVVVGVVLIATGTGNGHNATTTTGTGPF